MPLHHLVTADEWSRAEAAGAYASATLEREGFIHLSTSDQLPRTAERFYAGRTDLVVVTVREDRLTAPLRYDPADGEEFPHLYGPLNLDAVVEVKAWRAARSAVDDRVTELEVRIAYQDDVIASLNEVVRDFADRVTRLERELTELRKSQAGVVPIGPADEPPPHY